ncbi:MAG: portal protein [Nitrosopumilaceae archaeon]|nr:portal protein [Nitrosopumilaceae archaeon]
MPGNEMFQWLDKKKLQDRDDSKKVLSNQIATNNEDGAVILEDAVNEFILNYDFTYNNQAELINTYREVANYNEVDFAIEDIVNEAVTFGDDDDDAITLDLSKINSDILSDAIKDIIYEKWDKITNILDLNSTIHERFKSFYVDGRLSYQKVMDNNNIKKNGILNIVTLDPRYVTKFKEVDYNDQNHTINSIEEYFIYNENIQQDNKKNTQTDRVKNQFKTALKLNKESLVYITSGMTDTRTGYAISWLHKAVKPANQLRMMENALVVYRITRAPERRVFYVDTNGLTKTKAEQYIKNLKSNYRNRMAYDPEKGSFKDSRHLMTMQEDYWMPRNSSTGKGTEVSTLPGGANLGDIEDVLYFLKRLYKALNIPISRLESDSIVSLGRNTEINRDELKFGKFVTKVKKRFNMMFLDLLRTELILTQVITNKEWEGIKNKIRFIYAQDMYLEEQKKFEMMRDRLELLEQLGPYINKYYSNDYIRREILKQSEEEIAEEDKKISQEKNNKQFNPKEDEGLGF